MKNKIIYFVGLVVVLGAIAAYYFNADVRSTVNSAFTEDGGFLTAPINPGEGTTTTEQVAATTTPQTPATPTTPQSPTVPAGTTAGTKPLASILTPTAPLLAVKASTKDRARLVVGKIPADATFTISQSANVEPKQIPFSLNTTLDTTEKDIYQLCTTILKDGVRASETDCFVLDKNIVLTTKIGITDLRLVPIANDAYLNLGTNHLEIVMSLIKNDPLLVSKIENDSAPDLNLQIANAVAVERTGKFVLNVTK